MNVEFNCPECFISNKVFKGSPPEVYEHLINVHLYNTSEADSLVQSWMEDSEEPTRDCLEHGSFPADYFECPGCREVERQIDEAIEREHGDNQ